MSAGSRLHPLAARQKQAARAYCRTGGSLGAFPPPRAQVSPRAGLGETPFARASRDVGSDPHAAGAASRSHRPARKPDDALNGRERVHTRNIFRNVNRDSVAPVSFPRKRETRAMYICPWIPDRASRVRNDTVIRSATRSEETAAMTTDFKIGDLVEKHTSDYRAKIELRGVFTMFRVVRAKTIRKIACPKIAQ